MSIEKKIETIAQKIYGADGVEFSEEAQKKIDRFRRQVKSCAGRVAVTAVV